MALTKNDIDTANEKFREFITNCDCCDSCGDCAIVLVPAEENPTGYDLKKEGGEICHKPHCRGHLKDTMKHVNRELND